METGKFGVKLWCYAAAAFIFGVLDLYLGVIAVAAFAIIAEKDKWLNIQVIQAILLYLLFQLSVLIIDWSFGGLAQLFLMLKAYGASSVLGTIDSVIKGLIYVAYIVFVVIALFRLFKGKDGVFFLSKLSNKLVSHKEKAMVYDDVDDDQSNNEE